MALVLAAFLVLTLGILVGASWAVFCDYREQRARLRRMEEWAALAQFPRSAPHVRATPSRSRAVTTRVELPRSLDHRAVIQRIPLTSSGARSFRGLRRDGRRSPSRRPEFPQVAG
jgi:hypothetical protein